MVAVGPGLSARPPHRSVRAALPHTALTSGTWRTRGWWHTDAPRPPYRLSHTFPARSYADPALRLERVGLARVPRGWPPSLRRLRRRGDRVLVRRFPRYYAAIRLPAGVHAQVTVINLLGPPRRVIVDRGRRDLPVPVQGVSTRAQGRRLRGACRRLACIAAA